MYPLSGRSNDGKQRREALTFPAPGEAFAPRQNHYAPVHLVGQAFWEKILEKSDRVGNGRKRAADGEVDFRLPM